MKKVIILLALVLCVSSIQAQPIGTKYDAPKNRIGFSGSMISGWGLTYQRQFDPIAVKFVAFYYYFKNGTGQNNNTTILQGPFYNYNEQGSFGSFGVEVKYNVFESKYVNIYPFLGASYWFDNSENPDYYYDNKKMVSTSYLRTSKSNTYNLGGGLGMELLAGKYIAFNFDIGMKYLNTQQTATNYDSPVNFKDSQDIYFGFGVGGGVTFAF